MNGAASAQGEAAMKPGITLAIMIALVCILPAPSVHAATLDFDPPALTVTLGDPAAVNVRISGLGGATVGAFDLTVGFDPTILAPADVFFHPFLGSPPVEVLTDFIPSVGTVNFAAVSLLSSDELETLQPDAFVLATLVFNTLNAGTSPLIFGQLTLADASGADLAAVAIPGTITVVAPVPEPTVLTFVATGLGGLALRSWRRRRQTPRG
jgi:Cohesin domain